MKLTLDIIKVIVVRMKTGPDKICIDISGPPPFLNYEDEHPSFIIKVTRGTAEEWLRTMFKEPIEVEILDVSQQTSPNVVSKKVIIK